MYYRFLVAGTKHPLTQHSKEVSFVSWFEGGIEVGAGEEMSSHITPVVRTHDAWAPFLSVTLLNLILPVRHQEQGQWYAGSVHLRVRPPQGPISGNSLQTIPEMGLLGWLQSPPN